MKEKIEKETDAFENTANILKDKRTNINNSIEEIYGKVVKNKHFSFKITDHCVVQYLRPIELCPVSEAKFKILTTLENWYNEYKPDLETLKDVYVKVKFGNTIYLIQNKTIITVLTEDG